MTWGSPPVWCVWFSGAVLRFTHPVHHWGPTEKGSKPVHMSLLDLEASWALNDSCPISQPSNLLYGATEVADVPNSHSEGHEEVRSLPTLFFQVHDPLFISLLALAHTNRSHVFRHFHTMNGFCDLSRCSVWKFYQTHIQLPKTFPTSIRKCPSRGGTGFSSFRCLWSLCPLILFETLLEGTLERVETPVSFAVRRAMPLLAILTLYRSSGLSLFSSLLLSPLSEEQGERMSEVILGLILTTLGRKAFGLFCLWIPGGSLWNFELLHIL